MFKDEPTTSAQKLHDTIYDGTATVNRCAHDLEALIEAMAVLGMPASKDLANIRAELLEHSRKIAGAFGEFAARQRNGTLHDAPASTNEEAA